MNAVVARDLRLGYGDGPDVVRDVNLEVRRGETVAILGASGCGKSTLVKAIAGLITPRSGTLEVLGKRFPQRPGAGAVGYVPQRLGLVRHTSVLDNVVHGGLHETTFFQSLLHRAPPDIVERSWHALEQVGLADKAHDPVHRLSGGQQRRTAVARALVQRPQLLLADEFLGELDPDTAATVMAAVATLPEDHGTTVILVEHHLDQARRLTDRVLRLGAAGLEVVP